MPKSQIHVVRIDGGQRRLICPETGWFGFARYRGSGAADIYKAPARTAFAVTSAGIVEPTLVGDEDRMQKVGSTGLPEMRGIRVTDRCIRRNVRRLMG